ncbi:hypothetical protein E2C01_043226 [Portunus trituberculatus]|uniref:Uncharacterized protein n=1 Tax=Portunus trituberculatus TaxID=210409 RepID=A0A5B7FVI8_PORTR|nr:hypothetical protein [Portunus trituberculatus]
MEYITNVHPEDTEKYQKMMDLLPELHFIADNGWKTKFLVTRAGGKVLGQCSEYTSLTSQPASLPAYHSLLQSSSYWRLPQPGNKGSWVAQKQLCNTAHPLQTS